MRVTPESIRDLLAISRSGRAFFRVVAGVPMSAPARRMGAADCGDCGKPLGVLIRRCRHAAGLHRRSVSDGGAHRDRAHSRDGITVGLFSPPRSCPRANCAPR
jgi:hypothetical protein